MPTRSRSHPSRRAPAFDAEEDDEPGGGGGSRLAVVLAGLALLLAIGALAVAFLRPGGGPLDCQTRAWDAIPDETELPDGWAIATSSFFVGSMTATVDGPGAIEGTSDGSVFATVTCYGRDAVQALARARAGEAHTGGTVRTVDGVGDDGYSVGDESTGLNSIHFRRDDLVAYLAASGSVDELDLVALAEAFDAAIESADGSSATLPGAPVEPVGPSLPPVGSDEPTDEPPLESDLPSEAPAAPELEAMLPKEIDGTPLAVFSATGTDLEGGDTASRSLGAAIRAMGASMDELQVAEVYDETETVDIVLFAFRLPDANGAELRDIVLDSWLSATGPGVRRESIELDGKEVLAIDYGDEQVDTYVYRVEDTVVVIYTSDRDLVELAVEALP